MNHDQENEVFPADIMFMILIRLPVLSLLRFRCVSRFWYALINSLEFIEAYHRSSYRQIRANCNMLFTKMLELDGKDVFSLHGDDETFHEIRTFDSPVNSVSMVGCVNGLICLDVILNNLNNFLLWNPCVRKVLVLPEFYSEPPTENGSSDQSSFSWIRLHSTCFGFGYDTLSNDFKMVRMDSYGCKSPGCGPVYTSRTCFGVFSVNTRSWKTLDFCDALCLSSQPCTVGQFVYRFSFFKTGKIMIVSIDLNTEVFEEIDLPKYDENDDRKGKDDLMVYRDSLGLLRGWSFKEHDIWAMKEDGAAKSWMKLFTILLEDDIGQQIIGFTVNQALLVIGDGDASVTPAKEDAQVVKYVPPDTEFDDELEWRVGWFKETLLLLDDGVDQSLIGALLGI